MKTTTFWGRRYAPAYCSIFILLFCFTFSAYSTVYYISTAGNDVSGTGTIANPWKTLYKATTAVTAAGDIIHIYPGTYTETTQSLLMPGVSIEGEGATSIIKSTLTSEFQPVILARSAVENTDGNQHISYIKMDGQNTTSVGIMFNGRKNISVHHCEFLNFDDMACVISGKTSMFPNDEEPGTYATGIAYYNNTSNNCAGFDIYGRAHLWATGTEGMLIHDNTMVQTQRPDGQNGWLIKAMDYNKGMKIYSNVITKAPYPYPYNGYTNAYGEYWDFAIEMADEQGLEIYNNTIQGSIDMNRQTKGTYPYSVYIHNNTIGAPTTGPGYESGIILEYGTETATIENNTFRNIHEVVTFSTRDLSAVNDITIRKNLAYNILQNGIAIRMISNGSNNYTIHNFELVQNTFVGNSSSQPYFGANFSDAGSIVKLDIKNNIFKYFSVNAVGANRGSVIDSCNVSYNDFNGVAWGTGTNIVWGGGTPTHYTNTPNTMADPLFVSTTNFNLQASSTLIDAGIYVGLPYWGTAPDRGYAEFNMALPVKLIDFTVSANTEKNLLQWKTVTESNSDYFSVERSSDGQNYQAIGRVNATGFSSNAINYNFTDAIPLPGINYYRLVMVDKDNSFEYSNIVNVNRHTQGLNIVSAGIFTGKKQITLNVTSDQNKKATLMVFDISGRQFLAEKITLQKGVNAINKTMPATAKGIYFAKLFTDDEVQVKNVLAAD